MVIRLAGAVLLICSSAHAQSVVIGAGAEENVTAGSQIAVGPQGIQIQSGGKLSIVGASGSSQGRFLGQPSGGAGITVQSGGQLDIQFALLENLTTLTVNAGGNVLRIHDTEFRDLSGYSAGALPWIDLSAMGSSDRENLPFSFNKVSFVDNQTPNDRVNIKAGANTPLLRLLGNPTAHGNTWGESFDDDTANRVLWHSGAVSRNGGATFDTIADALADAGTTAASTLTVNLGSMAFIDERIDFNAVGGGSSATGPTIRNACLAPTAVLNAPSVEDSDANTDERGVLVNCVVARGNVSETTAKNCTFFWPVGSPGDVSYSEATNLLVQSGYTGTGNGAWTTSIANATSGFFVGASSYNLHLARTGGDPAIDEGTALSADTDLDGESRGNDGKPGGSGTWDIGADEVHVPAITWGPGRTRDATPRITGTGIPGATVTIYRNGQPIGTAVVQGDGTWSYEDLTALGSGDYTYTAGYSYGGVPGYPGSNGMTVTVDVTPPPPPTNVRTTAYNGCIDVTWDPVDTTIWTDFAGYQVWRRPHSGGAWAVLHTGLVVGTKYRDSTVVNGTAYDYKVTSSDNAPLIE